MEAMTFTTRASVNSVRVDRIDYSLLVGLEVVVE